MTRPIFWPLLHRADVPWHRTEEVRQHLRNAHTVAPKQPQWSPTAGPLFNPFPEDEWFHADECLPWTEANISRRRGHERPSDNDDGPPSARVN